jgi:hypothetical protein
VKVGHLDQDIITFLRAAIECSVLLDPLDPGLAYDEILEVGRRVGYQAGEIGDNLKYVTTQFFGSKRLVLDANMTASWIFLEREEPEFRNFDAFDFVVSELNALAKSEGAARARLPRRVLAERAGARQIPRKDTEAAMTYMVMAKMLNEKDGIISFPGTQGARPIPSEGLKTSRTIRRPDKARAYPFVRDVIERRADGRPKHAEPFDAFADELDKLGFGSFRLWWKQAVAELSSTDPNSCPVSASVLSAALVEGSLTFVVKHARELGVGVFQSNDFDRDPRAWKIDDLVKSAASGGVSAILGPQAKSRAETLIRTRQRIHAGRMLSDFPAGPPDIRPEEARDAKATAEQVVRCVLDWLQKNPRAP